jgi:pimeloyl-ACP methyl ester carboxylesterase
MGEQQKKGYGWRLWRWVLGLRLFRVIWWAIYLVFGSWIWVNWHADKPISELKKTYSYPESRLVAVDGMQVHVRMAGKGETVLLLHDAGSSLHTWEAWFDTLSKHYEVIAVDLPGHGLTGPHPRSSYSAFMYIDFLLHLTKALDVDKFHLAGNGMGAQIAWFFAVERQSKIRSLTLLNAPGFETRAVGPVEWLARIPLFNRLIWKITPESFLRVWLEELYADDQRVGDALVMRHVDLLLAAGNRKAYTDRCQVKDNRPPAQIIEKISVPTLIMWGAEDTRISPEFAYDFHKRIRSSFLKIYQNTGHWPQEENPAETVTDMQAFLHGSF